MLLISRKQQASLNQARELFSDGEPLPSGLIPAELEHSWERSRLAGLTPHSRRLGEGTPERLQEVRVREEHQSLIRHVAPEMELLWQSLADPHWTVLCMNHQGTIIHSNNAAHTCDPSLRSLTAGRTLLEMQIGTTAPICALTGGRPFTVHANQHYLSELDRFFCAAMPIRSLDGQVIAALDVTGVDSHPPLWLQERLNFTATSIENRLFLDLPDCSVLHVHADPRFIGTPLEGIIAIDAGGCLIHANRSARCLLGIDVKGPIRPNLYLDELLGKQGHLAFDKLRTFPEETHLLPLASGYPLYSRLYRKTLSTSLPDKVLPLKPKAPGPDITLFNDRQMDKAFDMARLAFGGEVPILIQGETGTGKEVFAKALHNSFEPDHPFVAINCSAIPDNLIEAELFGYSEGAFTGGRKGGAIGKLELANGGTLFLDEIGDMPLDLQTRLLRVLQERTLTRLGDTRTIALDVRLISASHRDIETMIEQKAFREDLFYRINGLRVVLPPLRERSNFTGLIQTLLEQLVPHTHKVVCPAVLTSLMRYNWPGNVRQLQQALKVASILSGPETQISLKHFPPDLQAKLGLEDSKEDFELSLLERLELGAIREALARNQGNISATAQELKLARGTLYKKLRDMERNRS